MTRRQDLIGGDVGAASASTQPARALDIAAVADRLSVSPHTVRKYVRLRLIPYHKVGAAVRFRPEDVEAFFEAGRVAPLEEARRLSRKSA